MVGFISNLAPLLNYLRRRSPGPPFPPDHRQAGERGAIKPYQRLSMFIDERRQRGGHDNTHSPTFNERMTYGDTDQNLGQKDVNFIYAPSHAPCGGGDRPLVTWRLGRLLLPLPLPSLPPRFVGALPYPLPHVDRHLSGATSGATSGAFSPLQSTFRHMFW